MKELSIEEKAKRYDEAIEKFDVILHLNTVKESGTIFADDVRKILPELKESEDERIRKTLLGYFKDQDAQYTFRGLTNNEVIDWLKKQGEVCHSIMWHSVFEEPEEMQELLCKWESNDATWHEVAFYHADTKTFWDGGRQVEGVIKWIYINELLEKQGETMKVKSEMVKDYIGEENVWNNARDFRPEHMKRCLCYDKYMGGVYCYVYDDISKYWCTQTTEEHDPDGDNHICDYADYRVTVWMSLPRTPFYPEKQGEQKPTDKVEPKFKIGDWVVYCNEDVDLITCIEENGYCINNGGGYIPFICASDIRLWTIQDAKDGDILVDGTFVGIFKENSYNPSDNSGCMFLYCSFDINNDKFYLESGGYNPTYFYPATKEQRALLFQKMKEAGYMWDADKKELKKISQEYPLTTDECIKPAWSEEDNGHVLIISDILEDKKNEQLYHIGIKVLNNEIAWLKSLKDRFQPQPQKEWSEDDENILEAITYTVKNSGYSYCIGVSNETMIEWLKSLKDKIKPQWKPSDEQIEAIRIAGVVGTANDSWAMNILKDMYLQLNGL